MTLESGSPEITYATGEPALVGDQIVDDVWHATVTEVISTLQEMDNWGVSARGVMLLIKEAGLVFEEFNSPNWDAIILISRGKTDNAM